MDYTQADNKKVDHFGSGKHGYQDRNLPTNEGTTNTAEDRNMILGELMNLIEGAGLAGDSGDLTQVLAAVNKLTQNKIVNLQLANWTAHAEAGFGINDMAYGAGVWVFVGGSSGFAAIFSSADAETLTDRTPGGASGAAFDAVHFADGLFVATGGGDCFTSPDGTTWTSRTGPTNALGVAHDGDTTWVAVGGAGTIHSSSNGTSWTSRSPDGGFSGIFRSVTWSPDAGVFVAVGDAGEIQTSPDGTTWTQQATGGADNFYDVESGDGIIVAVGQNGRIETSTDGASWTERTAAESYTGSFVSVTSDGEGRFLVTGGPDGTRFGFQRSEDGINWVEGANPDLDSGFACGAHGDDYWLLAYGESTAGWMKSLRL